MASMLLASNGVRAPAAQATGSIRVARTLRVSAPPARSRAAIQARAAAAEAGPAEWKPEAEVPGMTELLDGLKYNDQGLVAAVVQDVDTGEVLMQAFADRAAICETLQTKRATFYSRSRKGRWCKGETSGNFIDIVAVHPDCDRDSLIYLGQPKGPSCHTNSHTCWYSEIGMSDDGSVKEVGAALAPEHRAYSTLYQLERTIEERRVAAEAQTEGKPSWTARLLNDEELLCSKIREEAGELCETLEKDEGKERAASECADVIYHSLVLLNKQGAKVEDVMRVLRGRFGVSGIDEKAARAK